MKYLDQQIIVTLSLSSGAITESKTYVYEVVNTSISNAVIYRGNVYIPSGATSVNIDITDICRTNVTPWRPFAENANGELVLNVGMTNSHLLNSYMVVIKKNNTTISLGSVDVLNATRYPNSKIYLENYLPDYYGSVRVYHWGQGGDIPDLLPHYPLRIASKYGVVNSLQVQVPDATTTFNIDINIPEGVSTHSVLNDVAIPSGGRIFYHAFNTYGQQVWQSIIPDFNGCEGHLTMEPDGQTHPTIVPFAIIDKNSSKYYLMWMDRLGGIQSQPFGRIETFSEDFSRKEILSSTGVRKLIGVDYTPKWSINSGWVSEHYYPYYESIFCSPWLYLYDADENKVYEVVCKDNSYTEKTFSNQGRQLFNVNLTLESATQGKLIY